MLVDDIAREEQIGAIFRIRPFIVLLRVFADNALELLVARHQTVFWAEDPEVVLEGAVDLLLGGDGIALEDFLSRPVPLIIP